MLVGSLPVLPWSTPCRRVLFVNRRNWLICLGLAACCLAIYGQTLAHDFVNYDDGLYVTDNLVVQDGLSWANVVWAFTTERAMYMHPLTWMSHMLDCNLYGLHPWGHHLTNLVFHTLNSILLFLVLARMTRRAWPSALAVALFAVHPLHVESVAWVAERKDVLSMFFWTGGLAAYVWHRQRPSLPRYLATAAMFLLGFLCKPMVVTFPFVLLLLDYWPLGQVDYAAPLGTMGRQLLRLAAAKTPLFLLTAAMCVVTMVMQMRGNNLSFMARVPFMDRCANAVVVYVLYLVKTVWPSGLAVYYPHPITRPAWQVAGAALVLIAVTAVCLREMRRRPYLIIGWLWYLGTLLPVIELVQAGTFSHADRYTYIPLIGVFIMVAWSLNELLESGRVSRLLVTTSAALAVAALSVAAILQVGYWKNAETLCRRDLAVTADNPMAHNLLGGALYLDKRFDEAYNQFQCSLRLDPRNSEALQRIAVIYCEQGRYEEALAKDREALAINPGYDLARNHLKFALKKQGKLDAPMAEYDTLSKKTSKTVDDYCRLGALAMTLGEPNEAFDAFAEAMKMEPNGKKVPLSVADVLVGEKKYDDALGYYGKALRAEPHDAQILYNMGVVLSSLKRPADAAEKYNEALRWNPDFAPAHNNLGSLLANAQRLDEAVEHYRKAIALDPSYAQAQVNLAGLLAFQGKTDEAVGLYEQAIKKTPDSLSARLNLARLLIQNHRSVEAETHLKKALEIDPNNADALKLMNEIGTGKPLLPASENKAQ